MTAKTSNKLELYIFSKRSNDITLRNLKENIYILLTQIKFPTLMTNQLNAKASHIQKKS